MAEGNARCITCGYLSLRTLSLLAATSPREFVEVDKLLRATPKRAMYIRPNEPAELQCFQGASAFSLIDLSHEGLRTHNEEKLLGILDTPRACDKWCQYQPGHSPKEHLMEQRLAGLEADRRAFQLALSNSGRGFVYLGLILGAAQVLTMTSESLLYRIAVGVYAFIVRQWAHLTVSRVIP